MRKNQVFKNPIIWILSCSTFLSFCFFLAGINSWRFALTGDDWQFYGFALDIIHKHFWLNPFSFAGVYQQNSVLASMYQAFFLNLLDQSVISWRFSNVILIIPSSLLFYFFVKFSFGRWTAVFSTVLMQFSFFLANYFKIGYINPQAFFLFILSLFLAALVGLHPRKKFAVFWGLSLGISFYVYIGPLFPLLVWPYLLPLFRRLKIKRIVHLFTYCVASYLLVIFPLLFTIRSALGPLHKTTLASQESLKISVSANILHEFLLFFREYQTYFNHYISGPYVDIVTQVFLAIGLVVCLLYIHKRACHLLLLSYVLTCIVMGVTNVYPLPPVTRGFMVLPYGFVFAGLGIQSVSKLFHKRVWRMSFLWLLFLIIIGANLYKSQIGVFRERGYTTTALVLQAVQEASDNWQSSVLFVISEKYPYSGFLGNFKQIQDGYGLSGIALKVNRPYPGTCRVIGGKKVIVLAQDEDALRWVESSPCGGTVLFSVLKPAITYY